MPSLDPPVPSVHSPLFRRTRPRLGPRPGPGPSPIKLIGAHLYKLAGSTSFLPSWTKKQPQAVYNYAYSFSSPFGTDQGRHDLEVTTQHTPTPPTGATNTTAIITPITLDTFFVVLRLILLRRARDHPYLPYGTLSEYTSYCTRQSQSLHLQLASTFFQSLRGNGEVRRAEQARFLGNFGRLWRH